MARSLRGHDPEITAIPLFLERLEFTGALVTIDAIGFQRSIAKANRSKGAACLSTIRHTALNFLRSIPDRASIKVRRKAAGWDGSDLISTIIQPWR